MGKIMPYQECPRFNKCSVPKCPLDPEYHLRDGKLKGEDVCGVNKVIRLRIAKKYKDLYILPYYGYTANEYKGLRSVGSISAKGAGV